MDRRESESWGGEGHRMEEEGKAIKIMSKKMIGLIEERVISGIGRRKGGQDLWGVKGEVDG